MMPNIIVVGAGIAGSALSIGLAKLGYSVDLVERRHDLRKRRGGAFGLQPNALKALQEICPEIMDDLYEKGLHINETGAIMCMWWTVRDALLEEVAKYPDKIKLWTGWTFSDFVDDDANQLVLAKFTRNDDAGWNRNDGHDSIMEIKGIMLVGADGVHSSVRLALNLPPAEFAGAVFWRGTIIVPEDSEVLSPFLDKGANSLYVACGPTLVTLYSYNEKVARALCWGMASKDPDACTKAHPMEVIQPYVDPNDEKLKICQAVFELADPEEIKYAIKCATIRLPEENGKGWGGKGRVTLVGDAAHAMRPVGGLGSAMALEDCVVLIRLLKKFGKDATIKDCLAIENVIVQFENSRLPRVRKIWNNQWETAEKRYKEGRRPPLEPHEQEFFKWVYEGV